MNIIISLLLGCITYYPIEIDRDDGYSQVHIDGKLIYQGMSGETVTELLGNPDIISRKVYDYHHYYPQFNCTRPMVEWIYERKENIVSLSLRNGIVRYINIIPSINARKVQ